MNDKENTRNNVFDSIIVLLFLLFALTLSHRIQFAESHSIKHGISCEKIVSINEAIIKVDIPAYTFFKTWISKTKYPDFINPYKTSVFQDRKTNNLISIQKDEVLKIETTDKFLIHYCYYFSAEKDDIPLLG